MDNSEFFSQFKRLLVYFFYLFVIPLVLGIIFTGVWDHDLSVPLVYGMHDDVWQLLLSKGLLDNGWILENQYLGAPSIANWSYHSAAQSSSIHSILMLALSFFFDDAVKVQQIYYLLNFSIITAVSFFVCQALKIDSLISYVVAVLFAFTTYRFNNLFFAFLANYYVIPISLLVCVWCTSGVYLERKDGHGSYWSFLKQILRRKKFLISVLLVLLIAIADGYYAFFCLLLLGVAAIVVIVKKSQISLFRELFPVVVFGALIIAINFLVMLPVQIYKNGHPHEFYPNGEVNPALVRLPMEAEVYSTSIKQLVAPIINHRIPVMAELGRYIMSTSDAARKFPVIRPPVSLGSLGTILLFLAFILLVKKVSSSGDALALEESKQRHVINCLLIFSLFILLTSMSGGLGTLILPTNDGHPAKRVSYATEVNHDRKGRKEESNPKAAPSRIPA
ncbi:hypothetical protein KOI40_17665, partial [Aestuariicella sp. G3-2]|uniref:hypothetical protein n=1 Tax=Pseudomaricurvus albidus TaxID=2842452 RepID=UPI001C0E468F